LSQWYFVTAFVGEVTWERHETIPLVVSQPAGTFPSVYA
jgi:hypothetical protein